jgi:hypothetical protein
MVRAKDLFLSHPEMALLGGRAGRIDTGPKMEVKGKRPIPGYTPGPLWQNDGQKYGYKYTKLTKVHRPVRPTHIQYNKLISKICEKGKWSGERAKYHITGYRELERAQHALRSRAKYSIRCKVSNQYPIICKLSNQYPITYKV